MNTDRFIAEVHAHCSTLDVEAVHELTLITLDSLCEHLPKDQCQRMAEQLPNDIADAVRAGGERSETTGVPMSLDAFIDKLMFRTELNADNARALARGVAASLSKALEDGEVEAVALDLPDGLEGLIDDE